LALALQATSQSGSVYMLRDAFFQITNVRTGELVQFLTSEDGLPEATELKTLLASGSYTVTLEPGWFLERISGPTGGGMGGSPGGFGGTTSSGGSGMIPVPVDRAFDEGPPIVGGASDGSAGAPIGVGGEGPIDPPTAGTSSGGSGPIGGGGGSVVPNAQLRSDAVQFFFLSGGDEAFVNYQFQVGGEVIDFTKGKLHVTFTVDDSQDCQVPADVTKPERVLLESNTDAVAGVPLSSAFQALATNAGHEADAKLLFQEVYDSYASADQAQLPDAIHCGDETTDGVPTLNGYPIDCNRPEAKHVNDMDNFFATAFVNRIDLAPANGAHCGQQRMIFANPSQGRAFMILEAQIPNPAPELGVDGCRPLAQFWMDQNNEPDPKLRGQRLAQAFLQGGVPGLAEFGFSAFFTAENLTVGSGQIRTNQFDTDPWTLREFKLALDGDTLRAVPFPVAESPNGGLWNEGNPLPQGDACRESFLTALDGVLTDNMNAMSFVVDSACKDAESRNDFSQDYASQLTPGFADVLQQKLLSVGSKLSPTDVANRARFSGSCIGCHNEASGSFLGNGVLAPFSNDFPQVLESPEQCRDGETGSCFATSNALNTVFLPARLMAMSNLLGVPIIPNPCNGGGGNGVGGSMNGTGGSISVGGFGTAGTSASGGAAGGPPRGGPGPQPDPAPVVVIDLPSADEPVEQMQEEEQEIRADYGDVTISGKSAKATH